jgi:outer membrane lipoprotein carrier protein
VKKYIEMRLRFPGFAGVPGLTDLCLTALCLTATLFAAASPTVDVHALAAAVDVHYNHLRSLQAEFTELYQRIGNGANREWDAVAEKTWQDAMGIPFSQREALRERWERCVVLRPCRMGRRAKTAAKKLEDVRSPLAFLLGKTKLEKELQRVVTGAGCSSHLHGWQTWSSAECRRGWREQITEIVLEITPEHRIARIVLQDVDGASTEYQVCRDRKRMGRSADSRFEFKPPAGTEVVEGELGQ